MNKNTKHCKRIKSIVTKSKGKHRLDQKPNGLMNSKVNVIKRSFGIRKQIIQASQYLNKNIILKQSREIAKS